MRHRVLAVCSLVACLGPARVANGQEVVVLNDSTIGGTPSVTGLASYLPGESAAAWLTATCSGDIVAAQIYWASIFGGAPSQLEQSVTVFSSGAFPAPGPVHLNQTGGNAVIVGPTLFDGVINEFRFLDPPTNAIPLRVPIAAGQTFAVALQFLNQINPSPLFPGPAWDTDGCQTGRNAYDAMPGGWADACLLGLTGDWVFRAVVDCQAPVPALGPRARGALLALLALAGIAAAAATGRQAAARHARARR